MQKFLKIHIVPLLFMAVIFGLSSIPGDVDDGAFKLLYHLNPTLQNMLHIPLYGLLQYLWLRSFAGHGKKRFAVVLICLGISISYGVLDEFHQVFVPGRYGSVLDMLLNVTGALCGTAAFFMFQGLGPSHGTNNIMGESK